MQKHNPIGVFDSGVGGLSVAREIFRQLPGEDVIYFGDTAHVPYGSKKDEELIMFGDQIVDFLISKGAKMIVVACNTSSSVSLDHLVEKYSLPIVDVIAPSIIETIKTSANNKIGVIATQATINSGAHKKMLLAQKADLEIYPQACPKFVPLVEKGQVCGREAYEAAKEYLLPLKEKGIDTLVLGCTHYPFLDKVIREIIGNEVKIIDPASETVGRAKSTLINLKGLNAQEKGSCEFWVSGDPESFKITGQKFLGNSLQTVKKVSL